MRGLSFKIKEEKYKFFDSSYTAILTDTKTEHFHSVISDTNDKKSFMHPDWNTKKLFSMPDAKKIPKAMLKLYLDYLILMESI